MAGNDSDINAKSELDYMVRFPRITAHIIAESLGYATPGVAAKILKDAKENRENSCEWIYSCYNSDPTPAVESAIRLRHTHHGYMASYEKALAIVRHEIQTGLGPDLASWF